MRNVIVNSTPLIVLSNINALDLLRQVYGEISIPLAVYNEVTAKQDSACLQIQKCQSWIHIVKVNNTEDRRMYSSRLHAGEVEVILLAREDPDIDTLVVLDDNAAKKTAKYLGLTVTGTLGVLLKAKTLGYISEVRPYIRLLRQSGMWIDDSLVQLVLNRAGEGIRS